MAFSLIGCGAKNTLVVATCVVFPPEAFVDSKGRVVGYEIDIVQEIAREMGKKLRVKVATVDGALGLVNSGRADMSTSYYISEAREQMVDFCDLIFTAEHFFIARNSDTSLDGKTSEQILGNMSSKRIGTATGSIMWYFMEEHPQHFGNSVKTPYEDLASALVALRNGTIDYILWAFTITPQGHKIGAHFMNDNQDLKLVDVNVHSVLGGFTVQKGNTRLRNQLDEITNAMLADGRLDAIFQKWIDLGY
jgi:polar amino acid transport system substrate-binding protein